MKKRMAAFLLTAVMTVALTAGCGSSSGSSSGSAAPEKTGTEEAGAVTEEAGEENGTEAAGEEAGEENGTEAVGKEAVAEAGTEEAGKEAVAEGIAGEVRETTAAAAQEAAADGAPVELQVFIAASLNTSMQEVAAKYNEKHPNVSIVFNADSSGKLLTQIEEGYECDVFFSAAQKQMNTLEEDGLVVEGTRADVVNNQVVVIKRKDTGSAVTGLADIGRASSIALADGSVPVGRYTRTAMMNLGMLPEVEDASVYTTAEVSDALGGVEISEQGNVSQVLTAVIEGSCEVGTTYLSDTYGYEDDLDILEKVSYDLTGNVIYPVCQVRNTEASPEEAAAAADFVSFITSDEAKEIFDKYLFDTNIE
ncbi:MAG: molybdate ABC transporter substrate-binding protein [Lachnospiraceae bacterium]|nr:molybdate ABC transporter substrate-binding protein [Lachnospiraceae bacterium]